MKRLVLFFSVFTLTTFFVFPAAAQDLVEFSPAVGIPGSEDFGPGTTTVIQPFTLGRFVRDIYIFGVVVGTILSAIAIMAGGFTWLTAGGNVGQVGQAKEYIGGALAGMTLLLLSWTILNAINPNLVKLKDLSGIEYISYEPLYDTISYCCFCEQSGGSVANHQCEDQKIIIPGTCQCNDEESVSVTSASACSAKGDGCQFQANSPEAVRAQLAETCKAKETAGVSCRLIGSSGQKCNAQSQCTPTLIAQNKMGACGVTKTFGVIVDQEKTRRCAKNYTCNLAYECDWNDLSNPGTLQTRRDKRSEEAPGCCTPPGQADDYCLDVALSGDGTPGRIDANGIQITDCAVGYTCKAFADTSFGSYGEVGRCQQNS